MRQAERTDRYIQEEDPSGRVCVCVCGNSEEVRQIW